MRPGPLTDENGQWVATYSDSHRNIEHPLTSRLRRSERATSLLTSPTSFERCSQIVHCGSNRAHATNRVENLPAIMPDCSKEQVRVRRDSRDCGVLGSSWRLDVVHAL